MAKAKTEVAVVEEPNTAVATVYDYGEDTGVGTEITAAEMTTPFITLLQALSPQVEDDDDLKAGMLYDVISGQSWSGEEGLVFQMAARTHEFVEWVPRNEGGGLVARHEPNSPVIARAKEHAEAEGLPYGKLKAGDDFQHDLVETYYGYINILTPDGEDLETFAVIPFKSTMIGAYQQFRTATARVKMAGRTPPLFAFRAVMTTRKEERDGNKFYVPVIKPFGGNYKASLIPPQHPLIAAGRELNKMVSSGDIDVDLNAADSKAGQGGESTSGDDNIPF